MRHAKGWIALLAAAGLVLAGCGSDDNNGSASAAEQTDASEGGHLADDATDDTADEATDDATDTDGTIVVDGTLDGPTEAWFTAYCSAISPLMTSLFEVMGVMFDPEMADDVTAAQQAIAEVFADAGQSFSATGETLAGMPPPNITAGDEIAPQVVAMFTMAGPQLSAAAEELANADVATMDDLSDEIDRVSAGFEDQFDTLSFDDFELGDDLDAAIGAIPACQPLWEMQESFGDLDDLGLDDTETGDFDLGELDLEGLDLSDLEGLDLDGMDLSNLDPNDPAFAELLEQLQGANG